MFDFFHWLFTGVDSHDFPAVGEFKNQCTPAPPTCGSVSMIKQGMIAYQPNVPTNSTDGLKSLNPIHVETHSQPAFLLPTGPAVNTDFRGKVFSFTGRVDPKEAVIDGVRIDWSAPPDVARVLVSPYATDSARSGVSLWHDATGWFSTKANGQMPGALKQSEDVIFSHPELVRRIDVQMKDFESSTKTQFGIDRIGLVTHIEASKEPQAATVHSA
jgi:hypothetical protein